MKLNIPDLDVPMRLLEPWTFEVSLFSWNQQFWKQVVGPASWPQLNAKPMLTQKVTLPAGTVLVVTRIDFRKDDPFPVRFHLMKKLNPGAPGYGRFWLRRLDANNANLEKI